VVPKVGVKVTWDCNPQKSSLPVTQTRAPQVPLNTPILVSYPEPQRLKVFETPFPMKVYHRPGAVFKLVTQVATASADAPTVVPVMVCPQLIVMAPAQASLGGGVIQLLFNVYAPAPVPKPVTNTS